MILAADSEGSDQAAHPCSLNWDSTVRACPEGIFLLGAAHLQFSFKGRKKYLKKSDVCVVTAQDYFVILFFVYDK